MNQDFRKPTEHNMKRRSHTHDYCRSGYYHITISTAQALHQPLGKIAGRLDKPDGDSDGPHVELSPLGQMVEQELRVSIQHYYPMLEVMEYVVMPEHLHFLLVAHRDIMSKNGKPTHLGHVIAGFKYGCNKRYWAMTGRAETAVTPATESPGTRREGSGEQTGGQSGTPETESPGTRRGQGEGTKTEPPGTGSGGEAAGTRREGSGEQAGGQSGAPETEPPGTGSEEPGGSQSRVLGDSVTKQEAPPLFDAGYCDVMPIDAAQLATQRAYIRGNPRSRLLRTTNRQWLQPQRHTVNTAVSIRALNGFLQRESPWQLTPDSFAAITQRLLKDNGYVICDSYGNAELLQKKLLPVVCHRKDAALFELQKARCMAEAASGTVLVSARISQREQNIMDAVSALGFPIIRIEDNGFPDIYHPSAQRMDDCASGRLLLLTPWSYQIRSHMESISTLECKTMNCIAQAVCRQKDDWWK
ncbi:MAG: hypothetical protein IJQ44_02875 [Bacteroidaceae bacterium]|nr:hypothetical protein [Bacteroidaceae bacterium]